MVQARQELDRLLAELGESAQFATAGCLTPVLPGLEVNGVGPISVPVSAADAKRLIAQAIQAPYGRGENTIVDTSVRRVWQIEPSRLTLRNPEWDTHLEALIDAVKNDLGISQKVRARLYKLLIYEKGSFFVPHRDSEKSAGMFATLIVCLPSRHQGGDLIVRHNGQARTIGFAGKDAEFKTHYAAFYADCEHEITPVTSGYRVCLVYNLSISARRKQPPSPPQTALAVTKAAKLLQKIFDDPLARINKLILPFQHQYTQASFDPRQLKGSDRTRLDVLVRAAASLDYQCYLALLSQEQSGEVDYDTWSPRDYWSRRSHHWGYDQDEEESAVDVTEMGEIYEEKWSLDQWMDPDGHKQVFGEMHLDEEEILSQEGKEDWLIRQEVHEATGNEGVSMDRWYRQAVLVIWPRQRYFAILAKEGQASALPALKKMAAGSKKPPALEACRGFAEQILDAWKPRYPGGTSCSGPMAKLLARIGTVEVARRFLAKVLPRDFDGSEGKALVQLCQRFGWQSLAAGLRDYLAAQKPDDPFAQLAAIVSICEALCCEGPPLTEERRAACTSLVDPVMQLLQRWDSGRKTAWYLHEDSRAGVVAGAFHMFAALSAWTQLEWLVNHVLANRRHYDLHKVLVPDVKAIYTWLAEAPAAQPPARRLLEHCLQELQAATAEPVEPPRDWKRDAKLGCKCQDCQALSRFLRDPSQRVGRFPMSKERRKHLHRQIDSHACDVTHVTERIGSPQTLVCTKTQASYKRRLEQYELDRGLLRELEALSGNSRTAIQASSSRRRKKK